VPAIIAARAGAPAGPGGGTTPPRGGGGSTAAVAIVSGAKLKLGKRVIVRVRVPGAGKVTATLKRGRRLVAAGKARAARATDVRVPMRLRVKPRKARGRLVLRVRWTGADGAVATARAKVRGR
jgi:hypothetical protein